MNAAGTTPGVDRADDERFMALALALGRRGLGHTWPNPAVGAVLVRDDGAGPVIVGRGWTRSGGRPHAETEALRHAGNAARGATLYVTLEPCSHHGKTPPCSDAIVAAGVSRVVSALEDPNPLVAGQGHGRLRAEGIRVDVGIGAAEARRAHTGHIRRMRDARPHVALKLAISADGKAGLAGRRPIAITGPDAHKRVHLMRAMYDAILTGIGTATSDDPLLTCRLPGMAMRSPVRVVLDRELRLSPESRLATTARQTPLWLITAETASAQRRRALEAKGAEILTVATSGGRLDLGLTLQCLADHGITRLMVEAGPILSAALVQADLIDEAVLLRSPGIIGADGIDALEGLPLSALTQSTRLVSAGSEIVGGDTIETFERTSQGQT